MRVEPFISPEQRKILADNLRELRARKGASVVGYLDRCTEERELAAVSADKGFGALLTEAIQGWFASQPALRGLSADLWDNLPELFALAQRHGLDLNTLHVTQVERKIPYEDYTEAVFLVSHYQVTGDVGFFKRTQESLDAVRLAALETQADRDAYAMYQTLRARFEGPRKPAAD